MDIHKKYVVYELNRVMGNEKYLALEKVEFPGISCNGFETEDKAIQALVDNKMTFEDFIIVKQIYIN